jgi:hypothetical protein
MEVMSIQESENDSEEGLIVHVSPAPHVHLTTTAPSDCSYTCLNRAGIIFNIILIIVLLVVIIFICAKMMLEN